MNRPPRLIEALLAAVIPSRDRELLLADLGELYSYRAERDGGWRARWWYARHAIGTWLRMLRPANRRAFAPGHGPLPDPPRERHLMESIWQDIRFAVRTLTRSPMYVAVVVLTLAIGVGINATIFTMVNALLLRPLPVTAPEELVEIYSYDPQIDTPVTNSHPDFLDLAETTSTLSGMAGHSAFTASLSTEDRNELIFGEFASGGFFELLGIQPQLGRLITAEDDRVPGGHPVAVLSHSFWQERFEGDAGVLGESITLNGQSYTVIGVAPVSFNGLTHVLRAEVWLPAMMAAVIPPVGVQSVEPSPGETRIDRRGTRWMSVKGRMAPGVTTEQVNAEINSIFARLGEEHPDTNGGWEMRVVRADSVRVHPMIDGVLAPVSALVLGLVGLVLLSACTNIAAMTLSRATARGREVAVRLALGAGKARLVRQLMTESLMLALLGGVGGILLAHWLRGLLLQVQPPAQLPLTWNLPMDWRVIAFTFGVSALAGLAFGLAPALRGSRTDLTTALKEGGRGSSAGARGKLGLRGGLVVVQVAVCMVLLVGAALVLRGARAASQVDVGFDIDGLVTLTVDLRQNSYERAQANQFYLDVSERLPALPGVGAVGLAGRVPLSLSLNLNGVYIEGHQTTDDEPGYPVDTTTVDAAYFEALGVPLLRGRLFGAQDTPDTASVALVSEAFQRTYFPEGAVGQRFHNDGFTGPAYEIVGVVADTKVRTVGEAPRPYVYRSREQSRPLSMTIVARLDRDSPEVRDALRAELRAIEPELVFVQDTDMRNQLGEALFPVTFGAWLLAGAGALALALVSVGLYGVIAYSVAQRAREIGVRVAVGAASTDVLALILRRGMGLVAVGALVGATVAAVLSQTLSSILYGVGALDPLAFATAFAVLALVAGLANWIPARRAARLDPVTALRAD
ncbi:MAG: FtsX-like permease family protein [Acidobacteria bacterium]|nr:FtsX-like permease family protein [Acidobacteriota bacterium]